jgi:Ring finger domain
MGLVLKCFFSLCCDGDDEHAESYEPSLSSSATTDARMQVGGSSVMSRTMSRGSGDRGSGLFDSQQPYQIAPQGSHDEEDRRSGTIGSTYNDAAGPPSGIFRTPPCCGGDGGDGSGSDEEPRHRATAATGSLSTSASAVGLPEFFRRIRDRWRMYDSLETVERHHLQGSLGAVGSPDLTSGGLLKNKLSSSLPPPSPLRQASSFDSSRDIPVISKDEVVLPGSELQKEMAMWQSKTLERHDDECVICMEGFDPSNPRMPTMCGCGENKTFFHLPCLYQWIEQCEECPSCRQRLVWEEF